MRKLFLALALALSALIPGAQAQGPVVGPGNIILCGKGATFTGTAALAQIIAAVSNQSIFICGWHITNTAAAGTFAFSYGTGSNCGTGTVNILSNVSVSNTAPATDHIDYAFLQIPVGNALCQNSTATVSGAVWFNQF